MLDPRLFLPIAASGGGIPKQNLLFYARDGVTDTIGLSIGPAQPGRAYTGDGTVSIAITGLLTTDTITADSTTVPTCTADGTLDIALNDIVYGVTITRGTDQIGYYPCAEGSGTVALNTFTGAGALPHGTISNAAIHTELVDGTGFDLNLAGFTISNGSGLFADGTIVPKADDLTYRIAKRELNGATLGVVQTLDKETDPDFSSLPPDTRTFLGDGKWYFTDAAAGSSFVNFPFSVTAGNYYEIFSRLEFYEDIGRSIAIHTGAIWSADEIASDLDDYEESCGRYGANVRRLHKATNTTTLFLRYRVSSASAAQELIVSDVVVKEYIPVEKTDSIDSNLIAFWGDSITEGSYPYYTRKYTPNSPGIYNGGVGGETSVQISTRMQAATGYHKYYTVICAGTNSYETETPASIITDIQAMVDALPHSNYLILSPLGSSSVTTGTTARTKLDAVKDLMSSTFGSTYLDIEQVLIDAHDPTDADDLSDVNSGITPRSLRMDTIHPNYDGHEVIAAALFSNFPDFFTFTAETLPQYPGPIKYNLTIVSGTGPADWVVSFPQSPLLISVLGLDSIFYSALGVPLEIAWGTLMALEGPVTFGSEERNCFAIYNPAPEDDNLAKANRYFYVTA